MTAQIEAIAFYLTPDATTAEVLTQISNIAESHFNSLPPQAQNYDGPNRPELIRLTHGIIDSLLAILSWDEIDALRTNLDDDYGNN